MSEWAKAFVVCALASACGCSTTFMELKGECVVQDWRLVGYTMRSRMICDLPPPDDHETAVRDREAMRVNPFPDLIDMGNSADSTDPNLLEKRMEYPLSPEDKPDNDE